MIMKKKNLLPIDVQKLAPEAIPRGEKNSKNGRAELSAGIWILRPSLALNPHPAKVFTLKAKTVS